jgi:predicted ATPase
MIAELQQLTSRNPWRERVYAQLMLALYRSGRQADALETYRHAREVLIEQLGIEPGSELQELHQAMLMHDPALEAPRETATVSDRRSTLPAAPNRTIGRRHDVDAVGERLRGGSVRLLTLTGPGGVGKTRLALEAACAVEVDFADGAQFVSLAAVRRSQDVPAAIVKSLAIIPLPGESAEQAVERFLADKHLLLVIDNCEHLPAAAPFIGRLPGVCPFVTVLATSREPLTVHAEQRYLVAPLALPEAETAEDPEALAGVDAVALFCERARAHDPGFDLGDANASAVAEICRRVDGLPLAIELAAARCGLLSPGEIAERLQAALGALGAGARDAPPRQQTLRATIEWSHELLTHTERVCFARFAAFAGGATVEAAEAITGAGLETLERLVAKSLLVRRRAPHGRTRLLMLETIRSDASERLAAAADHNEVRERHCRYYLALAQHHGAERALWGRNHHQELAVLDADIDNFEAALRCATVQPSPERALEMVIALGPYWLLRHRYARAVDWIDEALSMASVQAHQRLRVRALLTKDQFVWAVGRGRERGPIVEEAAALARRVGDPGLISRALQSVVRVQLGAARLEGAMRVGDLEVASTLAEEAIEWATNAGDEWEIAMAHREYALAAPTMPDLRARVEQAALLLHEVGNVFQLGALLLSVAYGAICEGCDRDATALLKRAEAIARTLNDSYMLMMIRGNSGLAALFMGEIDSARDAFREELELCREMEILPAHEALRGLAAAVIVEGDIPRAARLIGAATKHRYGDPEDPVDARLQATFFEPARAHEEAGLWDSLVREGAALGFRDAIDYALTDSRARRRTTL